MINPDKNNQPLDLSYLKDMSGDSAEFMIEMLEAFLTQTPNYLADLDQAIVAKNWQRSSECAHRMKPTFAYIGRDDVRDHMQFIEHQTRIAENLDEVMVAYAQLQAFIPVLYRQLEEAKVELQNRGY